MCNAIHKPGRILAVGALAALILGLSACAHQQPRNTGPYTINSTLADLKHRDVDIEKQELDPVDAQRVIDTYQQAISLFSTPQERDLALRRMADLTMVATEDQIVKSTDEQPEVNEPDTSAGARKVQQEASESGSLQYAKAITLYKTLIANAPKGANLAEDYYLLAKAYDLDGQSDNALTTLNTLVTQYPDSPFTAEAQFRRGEQYFLLQQYNDAAKAYAAVLKLGPSNEFYQHSLYKHGWSLYKQGDYDLAIPDFVALLDIYMPTPPPKTPEQLKAEAKDRKEPKIEAVPLPKVTGTQQKMEDDTLRVLSMSFENLDGANTISQYFQDHGHRIYEYKVYQALGELYLAQERYKDAADTFALFANRHPLHPMAPAMSARVIATYEKGGFPSLVLPYKEKFVEHYGVYSTFWKRATPETRAGYTAALQQDLVELAKHYHALAQSNNKPDDYMKAARWYREYLTTFPKDENDPELNMLLGQALFAARHFHEAVQEFERTSYEYPPHPGAEKAGYFALLAYQEELKALPKDDPTYSGLITKRAGSSLRFAKTYPKNSHTPEVLNNVIEDELYLKNLDGVIVSSQLLIKLIPPAPQALREKAWISYANALYDKRQFADAETAYTKVLDFQSLSKKDRATFQEHLATSIYEQGSALEKQNKLADAAAEYLRVGIVTPTAAVRANAEYDAATLLLKLQQYDQAITVLERFRKQFPDSKLAATVPEKLSLAYEKTGNLGAAAGELVTIAAINHDSNPELARQAIWQAADMKEKAGDQAGALDLYRRYAHDYPQPYPQNMEAQYKLAQMYAKAGEPQKRYYWLRKLVSTYNEAGKANNDRTLYLAAYGSYNGADILYDEFNRISLTQPLKKSLLAKKKALENATAAYSRTIRYGVLDFTTAANFKLGECYRNFANAILKSERPRGMDADTLDEYELMLEDQAAPFQDKAIAILQTNAERTKDGVWDQWIQDTFASLRKLDPARYNKTELTEESVDDIY